MHNLNDCDDNFLILDAGHEQEEFDSESRSHQKRKRLKSPVLDRSLRSPSLIARPKSRYRYRCRLPIPNAAVSGLEDLNIVLPKSRHR